MSFKTINYITKYVILYIKKSILVGIMKKPVLTLIFVFSFILIISQITNASFEMSEQRKSINSNQKIASDNNQNYSEGVILFAPTSSKITYLMDKKGEIIFDWKSDYTPGQSVYLLENGDIIRTSYIGIHPTFIAGGMAGAVQEIEQENTVIWEFEYSNTNYLSHHDIEPLDNGNILMIAWEFKSAEEAISKGRRPDLIVFDQLWPDHIIEVKPTGAKSGEIVWQWHVWDHLIQDYDPLKENYGIVKDHPELIDINYIENPLTIHPDWNHINSIDYNKELDQIILSVYSFNEIWIIDHSTTTEEAAGHSGGTYGKGGDILYRWGNPQAYKRGNFSDKIFFHQHDAQWIKPGLPGAGNILVFNYGDGRPDGSYSSIIEFAPAVDDNGSYEIPPNSAYGPSGPIWEYTSEDPFDFFSKRTSGAQRLMNGNTLICHSTKGIFFEVNYEKEIVWEYLNPYPNPHRNGVFKIRQYSSDHPGYINLTNQPANPDRPKGPTTGSVGKNYTFSTVTTDPQLDNIFYIFDWGDGTDSGWLGPFESGKHIQSSHIWQDHSFYQIKVKAKDVEGFTSGWSDLSTLSIPRYCLSINNPPHFLKKICLIFKILLVLIQ